MKQFYIPYDLQQAIINNKVVIFIGAGLSRAAGLPMWRDIVIEVLKNPAIEKGSHYIYGIENDVLTPLEVLDKIEKQSKRIVYSTFEQKTNKQFESDIYKTISSISGKLITTNYDRLIETNCQIPVIDPVSTYSLSKIDNCDEFLLKIHGDCAAIDNAIIFTKDYERLYGEGNGLAKFQLEKLVSSHTCLFVGFSMSDNYVSNLFEFLDSLYQGLGKNHYAISLEELGHSTVKTLKIDSYDDLPDFFGYLHGIKHQSINPEADDQEIITNTSDDIPEVDRITSVDQCPVEGLTIKVGNDTPPIIDNWTGRVEELRSLMSPYKVCFITGIGTL